MPLSTEQTELVVLPQSARYSCHQCGNCCSRYTVRTDQATHERLAAVDWSQYGERFKGRPLFISLDAAKAEGSYSHELARIGARWFSRATASLRGSRVVEGEDLFEGIQLTEMAARTLAPKPGVKSFGKFLDLIYDSPKFVPAAVASL